MGAPDVERVFMTMSATIFVAKTQAWVWEAASGARADKQVTAQNG